MSIEIKNGKFYRNGIEVKPTFGDWEQINALNKAMDVLKSGKVDAIVDSDEIVRYNPFIKFICPKCNEENKIYLDEEVEEDPDAHSVEGEVIECETCSLEFEVMECKTKNYTNKIRLEIIEVSDEND